MTVRIIHADARQTGLPDRSVHMVATSPPYWGLRRYLRPDDPLASQEIGAEPSPEAYIESMVAVGREIRRVMRDDGTWWLNLGDSYANGNLVGIPWRAALALQADGWILRAACPWIKASCMPESVTNRPTVAHETVFLLVKQREYFYDADAVRMGVAASTMQRHGESAFARTGNSGTAPERNDWRGADRGERHCNTNPAGRNLRTSDFFHAGLDALIADIERARDRGGLLSDPEGEPLAFLVNPEPYPGAHFAAWPSALVRPMILAGTSERGCCPQCGAQWVREVEKGGLIASDGRTGSCRTADQGGVGNSVSRTKAATGHSASYYAMAKRDRLMVGWSPSCPCPAHDPIPCTVLDPFGGTGQTGRVAEDCGRNSIIVELNREYLPLARERTAQTGLFAGGVGT